MKKNHFMTLPKLCAVALLGATTFLASCAVDGFAVGDSKRLFAE